MAKFYATVAKGADFGLAEVFTGIEVLIDSEINLATQTSTSFTSTFSNYTCKVQGTGFTFAGSFLTGGTITNISVSQGGKTIGTLKGSISYAEFNPLFQAEFNATDTLAFEKFLASQNWVYNARKAGNVNDVALANTTVGDGFKYNPMGNDVFKLGKGNDRVFAGDGNDKMYGDQGKDKLYAGKGKDFVDGGTGNDVLFGQQGNDKFKYSKGYGRDKIADFENNKDTVVLNDNLWKGNKSVQKVLNQFGSMNNGDFVLNFGNGNKLTIDDTKKAQLVDDVQIV